MENKVPIVSFIIPSYNSARTVKRCLDSIYALSLKPDEFEVIFVDDCSTDNTCELVKTYTLPLPERKGVNNLTLLKQPRNKRQGAARNRGVAIAHGEYICFVDSDDVVTEGIVDAIRLAKKKQTDMVAFHMAFVNENGDVVKEQMPLSFPNYRIFSGVDLQNTYPYWCSGPVAYIYSKTFIETTNYPFCEEVLYEDSDFVMAHLYYAQRMAYSSGVGYLAYYREGSTTHSMNYKNVADYLLLGTRMMALYERIKNERIIELENEGVEKFAEGVLEGACFNVAKSCRRLIKLGNMDEAKAFYERVDGLADRKKLSEDKNFHKYYYSMWTSISLRHKHVTIALLALLMPIYKIKKI